MNKKNEHSTDSLSLNSVSVKKHSIQTIVDFSVAKKNKEKSKKDKAILAILKEAEQLTW